MWRNIFSPTRAAWIQHLPRLRRLRSPQRAHDMDNRLHTQGTLHPHHNQGRTQVLESETKMSGFKYHPDYGYPNYYRVWAIECAQVCGVSIAADTYNVGRSTIYKWMAASKTNQTTGNTANN